MAFSGTFGDSFKSGGSDSSGQSDQKRPGGYASTTATSGTPSMYSSQQAQNPMQMAANRYMQRKGSSPSRSPFSSNTGAGRPYTPGEASPMQSFRGTPRDPSSEILNRPQPQYPTSPVNYGTPEVPGSGPRSPMGRQSPPPPVDPSSQFFGTPQPPAPPPPVTDPSAGIFNTPQAQPPDWQVGYSGPPAVAQPQGGQVAGVAGRTNPFQRALPQGGGIYSGPQQPQNAAQMALQQRQMQMGRDRFNQAMSGNARPQTLQQVQMLQGYNPYAGMY